MAMHHPVPPFQNSQNAQNQSSILSVDETGMTMNTNMLISNESYQATSTNQPQVTDRFQIWNGCPFHNHFAVPITALPLARLMIQPLSFSNIKPFKPTLLSLASRPNPLPHFSAHPSSEAAWPNLIWVGAKVMNQSLRLYHRWRIF